MSKSDAVNVINAMSIKQIINLWKFLICKIMKIGAKTRVVTCVVTANKKNNVDKLGFFLNK